MLRCGIWKIAVALSLLVKVQVVQNLGTYDAVDFLLRPLLLLPLR